MSLASDLKIIACMARGARRGPTHAARLERFYRPQAGAYDDFRRRLLHGRRELYQRLPVPDNGIWIDMGGGTGANLEALKGCLSQLNHVYLVDLCPSLLAVARARIARNGWTNVTAVEADATSFQSPAGPAQVITFSYSLTMIPDWLSAIEHARTLLTPGGHIGVVDFATTPAQWSLPLPCHSWLSRHFWPRWFAHDRVLLNAEHPLTLHRLFATEHLAGHGGRVPYLPGARMPYYHYVGRK